jgi:hypothetical protein
MSIVSGDAHDGDYSYSWPTTAPGFYYVDIIATDSHGNSTIKDNIQPNCEIWSMISSNKCDHYGSIEFEKY